MNKKIFTLLAGAFLMFAAVWSVDAQINHGQWDRSLLKLADPVKKLTEGANKGFYHLKVDSIHSVDPAFCLRAVGGNTVLANNEMNDSIVLFMGKESNGRYNLFIDTLNYARKHRLVGPGTGTEFASDTKAEESAASLWCVTVDKYVQGQNPIFDFVNKEQETMLEVDLHEYESWEVDPNRIPGTMVRRSSGIGDAPGGISGWQFSTTYATQVDSLMPLISYLTMGDPERDTVAVLCMDSVQFMDPASNRHPKVVVKIASAKDVKNGKVDGVLYFTLTEAAPFIVNEKDFNEKFGKTPGATSAKLVFDPDVNNNSNPFTSGALKAHYITDGPHRFGFRIDTLAYNASNSGWAQIPANKDYADLYTNDQLTNFWAFGGQKFRIDTVFGTTLDSLGYLHFSNIAQTQYLEVLPEYHTQNKAPMRYLKLGFRNTADGAPGYHWGANPNATAKHDSVLYGQAAFRLVYYPSGDSIYINSYQATYLPDYDNSTSSLMNQFQVSTNGWRDSVTQAIFTYWADTMALQHPDHRGWDLTPSTPLIPGDSLDMVTARLKHGRKIKLNFPEPYSFYHRLYVALQNVTGDTRVTLHSNNNTFKDGQINTRIHFDIYRPCKGTNGKTTIDPDLYLIRNEKGFYLHVALNSPVDSPTWISPADMDDVHPELLPSFQWVVEKQYIASEVSPIVFTNREFGELDFTAQLDTTQSIPFNFRAKTYKWNTEPVNANTVEFGKHNDAGKTKYTFISLPKQYKSDPLMGYTWIDPDSAIVSTYAFRYNNGLNGDFYLGVNNKNEKDSAIYADSKTNFEKMYFSLDTILDESIGGLVDYGYEVTAKTTKAIPDLVQLKRQAYRLTYKDPFLMTCKNPVSIANSIDDYYILKARGSYRDLFGKPVFYLRHVYHKENKNMEPAFALVQRMDTTTWNPMTGSWKDGFKEYLDGKLGKQQADKFWENLEHADTLNFGMFVAQVEAGTARLKMGFRANSATTVSTFTRERDDDPIYRRFNTTFEGTYATDAPDTVHFYTPQESYRFLYENTGALPAQKPNWDYTIAGVPGKLGGKNYLGYVSHVQYPSANTAIFVDTAYINRGTGYIKPQYLLMVDPQFIGGYACDDDGNPTIKLPDYIRGRYLINAHDSAYNNGTGKTDYNYIWRPDYTRLVFTDAVHANDHLYILGEYGDQATLNSLGLLTNRIIDGKAKDKVIDLDKLHKYATGEGKGKIRAIFLGTNTHKDCVFQFRLVERGSNDFFIESETEDRDTIAGPMIAPCVGGWVKIEGDVPTISKTDTYQTMSQAARFNVLRPHAEGYNPNPTDNDEVVTFAVVGLTNAVSIQNAANKKVVISNILGQTVANTTITSDNETITVPKGVVIVSVEGEEAVKTLVK